MDIWLVEASEGDYSDRQEWIIAAYTNQEQAEEHLRKLEEYAKENPEAETGPYDPAHIWGGLSAVRYVVGKILVHRHLDEYLEARGM